MGCVASVSRGRASLGRTVVSFRGFRFARAPEEGRRKVSRSETLMLAKEPFGKTLKLVAAITSGLERECVLDHVHSPNARFLNFKEKPECQGCCFIAELKR